MRKILFGFVTLILLAVAPAAMADDRDFTVVNATGYPIKFLGVNAPNDNVWNENELDNILRNGQRFKVKFSGADKGCTWNIKVTWADDNTSSIFKGLNLCKIDVVTLKYNKQTDEASYTAE